MKSRSISWTQDWGTYPDLMTVCVGLGNYQELINDCRRQKCEEWVKALEDRKAELDDLATTHHFTTWKFKGITYSVLWLMEWRKTPVAYSVLAHELIHAVSFVLGSRLDIRKENEAFAYQHQFLFKEIIKKLGAESYGQNVR